MESPNDQPLILRRSKRRASVISPVKPTYETTSSNSRTPIRKRASKRVRFSDSELLNVHANAISTGLTPAVRRASLGTPRARRPATPGRLDITSTVQFTPLRQALDDRCKRRIRRNGLSEEMNDYDTEKKEQQDLRRKIVEKDHELTKLKQELEAARKLTDELRSDDNSQQRVDEVEAELEALRQSFGVDTSEITSWDHVPRGAHGTGSEGGDTICIYEDEQEIAIPRNAKDQADALSMGLELESARQAKESFLRSSQGRSVSFTELQFQSSPAKPQSTPLKAVPSTPRSFYQDLSKQLKAAISRAEDAELALEALEGEVRALGFSQDDKTDASTDLTALANHFRQMRLDLERLMPGETAVGFNNPALLPEILSKLRLLSQQLINREAELKSMRDQQRSLKGNFEHAITAAEKANKRIKELETAIDESAEETLQARMRAQALEKDIAEKDSSITSLVTALKKYRSEVSRLEALISQVEKDQISALEEVKLATRNELTDQFSIMDAKITSEERGRRAAEESAVTRLAKINELESALSTARQRAEVIEQKLVTLEQKVSFSSSAAHEEEVGALNSRISILASALASANAEVEKLRTVNVRLEERYRTEVELGELTVDRMQHEMIRGFSKLSEQRKSYLRGSKMRLGNWDLESDDYATDETGAPMTPASLVRFMDADDHDDERDVVADDSSSVMDAGGDGERERERAAANNDDDDHVPGSVEVSRGRRHRRHHRRDQGDIVAVGKKGRRKYDSGIGMAESSSDVELESEADHGHKRGIMTPEFSSEAGDDVEMEHEEMNDDMTVMC